MRMVRNVHAGERGAGGLHSPLLAQPQEQGCHTPSPPRACGELRAFVSHHCGTQTACEPVSSTLKKCDKRPLKVGSLFFSVFVVALQPHRCSTPSVLSLFFVTLSSLYVHTG